MVMAKRIKVSWFFVFFFMLMAAMGMASQAAALVIALFVHELGHIFSARVMGCRVEKIQLLPWGGYMYLDQLIDVQPVAEIRIALAGPVANLLAAAAVMALAEYSRHSPIMDFLRANLVLMTFNLLPALPLDGGRVLRALLTGWLPFYRATKIVIGTGAVCGLFLSALGIFMLAQGQPNPSAIAAGVFLLYNAYKEKKQVLVPLFRYALGRQKSLAGARIMPAHDLVAVPDTRVYEVLKHIRPQKYYQIFVLDEQQRICGIITEHQLLREILTGAGQRPLYEIVDRKEE